MRQRWLQELERVRPGELDRLRDLLIESFLDASFDAYASAKQRLGLAADNETIYSTVTRNVRQTMARLGADFEHPTPSDLEATLGELVKAANAMGVDRCEVEMLREHFLTTLRRVAAGQ